ncbi:hypothetical protein LMH87_010011 [Akanthomyces muscarius]|uniref:Uncharacterized protein n=1 Tax=Akanthomyces muscarius TaxID=2231603 RepID=A0A9W8QD44_AKAMU|nr:hypothetical protein LMH87_010011 [Akanthomyces muscarius]KAJ4153527.1 hypothetical protein LMH87_010011 [Akanthomyces muscarius]
MMKSTEAATKVILSTFDGKQSTVGQLLARIRWVLNKSSIAAARSSMILFYAMINMFVNSVIVEALLHENNVLRERGGVSSKEIIEKLDFFGKLLRGDRVRVWGALQQCQDLTVNRAELQSIERTAKYIDRKAKLVIGDLPSRSTKKTRSAHADKKPKIGNRPSRAVSSAAEGLAQPSESTRKPEAKPGYLALDPSCSDLYLPAGGSQARGSKQRPAAEVPAKTSPSTAASQLKNRPAGAESGRSFREREAVNLLPSGRKVIPDVSRSKGEQVSSSKSTNVVEHVATMDRARLSPQDTSTTKRRKSGGAARIPEDTQSLEKRYVAFLGAGDSERLARRQERPLQARVSSVGDDDDDEEEEEEEQNNSER